MAENNMVSHVKNVRKFLTVSALEVYVSWRGKRLSLQPLWLQCGNTELLQHHQFTCIAKPGQETHNCLMPHCCVWPGLPV